jgi:uncharacterized membrane protein YjjP (DUF1212 family)
MMDDGDLLESFLTRLTELALRNGGEGVGSLRRRLERIATAHGAQVELGLLPDSATLRIASPERETTRVVTSVPRMNRLDRVLGIIETAEQASDPGADLESLGNRLHRLADLPSPYAPPLQVLGLLLFAAGFSVSVQSTWTEVGVATLSAGVVALLLLAASSGPRLGPLLPLAAATLTSTLVLSLARAFDLEGGPVLLMIPALFVFIPGDTLSVALEELAEGSLSAGVIRLGGAFMVLLVLFLGIVIGAAVTDTPSSALFNTKAPADIAPAIRWLSWTVFALGFALVFSLPLRFLGWVLVVLYGSLLVLQLVTAAIGQVEGLFVASLCMIILAHGISRGAGRPPLIASALCAFFALTVGALGLEGLTTWVTGDTVGGLDDLASMFALGGAISLGIYAGHVLRRVIWASDF